MGLAREEEEDEERPLEAVGNILGGCVFSIRGGSRILILWKVTNFAAIAFSDLLPELKWRRCKSENDDGED